ncbi:MAG: tetratricopeptide repeat protein [Pseudobdellovibrionaceae bacterium]
MKQASRISTLAVLLLIATVTETAFSKDPKATKKPKQKVEKGLLGEIHPHASSAETDTAATTGEILVAESEQKAIQSLQSIIKRKKGSREEPSLYYRLAELYMRRAKSGRFFDLNRDNKNVVSFAAPWLKSQSAKPHLETAIGIYEKIQKDFPKFDQMDAVHFNNAFANQQLNRLPKAQELYRKIVTNYPNSPLIPDTYMAMGEMKYNAGQFNDALENFKQIEKFPSSRLYSYGIYKAGWSLYNMKKTEDGMEKLEEVVRYHDKNTSGSSHNLRGEALRDLGLFFSDDRKAPDAYSYFKKLTADETELGEIIISLGKLYDSHSRQKEAFVFLGDYLDKHPEAMHAGPIHLILIDMHEFVKDRPKAIAHLTEMNELCLPPSSYLIRNQDEKSQEVCKKELPEKNLDLAKKWWELWQKNKGHKDVADWTEKAFRLHLARDREENPDTVSRFAFAELLFQRQKYREASEHYEKVTLQRLALDKDKKNKLTDPKAKKPEFDKIGHDSLFGAIISLEKEPQKEKKDTAKIESLSESYLKRFPEGSEISQIQLKLGFIAYEDGRTPRAESFLIPLTKNPKREIATRAQDLHLDILNLKKDYVALQTVAAEYSKGEKDQSRLNNLKKIETESNMTRISLLVDSGEKVKAAEEYLKFSQNTDDLDLAAKSMTNSISLFYKNGRTYDAAELSVHFVEKYPKTESKTEILETAAKTYADLGLFLPAAKTLEKLAVTNSKKSEEYLLMAVDFYTLEQQMPQSRRILKTLIQNADKGKKPTYLSKLIQTYPDGNSSEVTEIKNQLVGMGLEPWVSEFQLEKLQAQFDKGKYTEAFESARKLMSSSNNKEARAQARLLQGKILEREFVSQSVKSKIDRLAMVLALKTEKLEKVQQAYLGAIQMSGESKLILQALHGLKRSYANYSENISNVPLSEGLTESETLALRSELENLSKPIVAKRKETEEKIAKLEKNTVILSEAQSVNFDTLEPSDSVKPHVTPRLSEQPQIYAVESRGQRWTASE